MTQITDAAVKAALDAHYKYFSDLAIYPTEVPTDEGAFYDALKAALPHLPLSYEVKKLEWGKLLHTEDYNFMQSAETSIGKYVATDSGWFLQGQSDWYGADSLEDAKSAAQADFERRVRASTVGGVDVAEVRRQALEEAATLIDEGFDKAVGKSWRKDEKPSKNDKCLHDKFMYEDCEKCVSAAIRALSAQPALKGKQHDK